MKPALHICALFFVGSVSVRGCGPADLMFRGDFFLKVKVAQPSRQVPPTLLSGRSGFLSRSESTHISVSGESGAVWEWMACTPSEGLVTCLTSAGFILVLSSDILKNSSVPPMTLINDQWYLAANGWKKTCDFFFMLFVLVLNILWPRSPAHGLQRHPCHHSARGFAEG